jgi:peptidoglycan/xylan/chitin deacetylase (PgdA/CDA1 family)/uncharacterized protein YgiM (DUF1202 family)
MEKSNHFQGLSRRGLILSALASTGAIGKATLGHAASPAGTIFRGPVTKPIVALTFDGGSDSGHCASILNSLKAARIKATFPLTGQFAVAYPALVRRIVEEGHQLVNHSFSHPSFTGVSNATSVLSTTKRTAQLTSTEEAFVNAASVASRPWFRPPYGDYDNGVLTDLGNAGFSKCLLWSIDLLGWNGYSANQIVNRVNANHGNGYIYLMHVGSDSQEGPALPRIISLLQQKGYGFATVTGMLGGTTEPAPSPTPAAFQVNDTVRVTSTLNLRTAPNLGGRIIVELKTNATGTVLAGPVPADGYIWYHLNTSSGVGWAATISLVKVTTAPNPAPTPSGYAPGTKVVVTSSLRLRGTPSTSGTVLVTMPTGTACTVLSGPRWSGGYGWYEVTTPYGRGWAAGEHLARATPNPVPNPTPPPTPGDFTVGDTVRITAALYLRSAPALASIVHLTMPTGTLCTVVGGPSPSNGYTWYQVQTTFGTGWAAGEFLAKSTGTPPAPIPIPGNWPAGTRARVTSELRLRATPSTSGRILTTMPAATIITVISGPTAANGYAWYQVTSSLGSGWAASEYLSRL